MSGSITKLGQTLFTSEGDEESFKEMLSRINLKGPVVIKPNWSSSKIYTESQILDWVLSTIDSEVIVVESYAMWRNEMFIDTTQVRDSAFLERLGKLKKSDLRKNDEWFLEFTGIQEVLDKHDVEYLNISEELWANRVCKPELIQKEVEKRFLPLEIESLLSSVPSRLYDLKGGTLLNLSKPKRSLKNNFVSLTLKNMFGMIPDPWRGKYHGENDVLLSQSIIVINKIYESLFDVKGIIEGIFTTSETIDSLIDPTIHSNTGYLWGSENSPELDAFVTFQLGMNPYDIEYLKLASDIFGSWNHGIEEFGKKHRVVFPRK
ncbi:MAG: DUF362 domain-containing protein [Candidatus Thorarchaeota archaeon]|nr:DUF362 domain-containing protein [Candidatus Thorarchaeota archaeon]